MVVRLISQTFRSLKPLHKNKNDELTKPSSYSDNKKCELSLWSVYLILSTNKPIKTYVGVTTNFSRRLRQHNGELKGGAKASRSGRPWVCACLVQGFTDKSTGTSRMAILIGVGSLNFSCEFESKWKSCSRKLTRKRKAPKLEEQVDYNDDESLHLLQHRDAALDKVKGLIDCSHLEIVWQREPGCINKTQSSV